MRDGAMKSSTLDFFRMSKLRGSRTVIDLLRITSRIELLLFFKPTSTKPVGVKN